MVNNSSNQKPSFDNSKLKIQHGLRKVLKEVEEVALSTNEALNEIGRARAEIQEYDRFRNMFLTLDGNMEHSLTELDSRAYELESVIAREEQLIEKIVEEQSKTLSTVQMVYEELSKMEKAEAAKKPRLTLVKKSRISSLGKKTTLPTLVKRAKPQN